MSDLTTFRDHARRLASGKGHTPACEEATQQAKYRWSDWAKWGKGDQPPRPTPCPGDCVTEADRELWTRLASEINDYLAPQPDLFGELSDEPHHQEAAVSGESEA